MGAVFSQQGMLKGSIEPPETLNGSITTEETLSGTISKPEQLLNDETLIGKIVEYYLEQNPPAPGQDGFSPTVEVVPIEGGNRIIITTIEGRKIIDVLNGQDGEKGEPGYTPVSGKDYYTDEEKQNLIDEIKEGLIAEQKQPLISTATLLASKWVGQDSLYHQVVTIEGVTKNSQVDLTPSAEQLAIFYEKDLTFVAENDGGVVTVYLIGQKPANDYVIQVTITEVSR